MRLIAFSLPAALAAAAAPAQAAPQAAAPPWTSGGYNNSGSNVTQAYVSPSSQSGGNTVVINGEIQSPGMTSVMTQYSVLSGGAQGAGVGAGFGTATAVGTSLTVQVQGSGDTVIVSSVQTNTGAVSATVSAPK